MPKNCTSLYVFDILNGNIVGNSIRYNDLYTEMHNADPNAHQALFEAVYNKIEEESDGLHNEIVTETNRAKQAEQQLQDNIDNESTARQQADTTLQNNINAEKTARENADTALQDSINTHIQNKNNPHNVTADQIGNVVKTINNLVNNISITGGRGTNVLTSSNSIAITGPMYDVPSNPSLDNMLNTGIYALSANVEYTTTYSGLPNKTGWLYLLVYAVGNAKKQIIYNTDGTAYRRENAQTNWLQLYSESGGGGTAGVSSINSLTGALTLNGDQGVRVTNTGNALQVRGQYYVLSQNTSINGTLRPGITAAGNYAFTNTPQNKSVMYVITVDYKSNEYIYAQYAVCFDYSIYRRLSNADGSTATEWYYNGVTDINGTKGSIIFEARNGATISKSSNTFTVLGPIARSPNISLNTNNSVGIFSFDYDSSPVGMPTEATNAYVMLQVMTDGTNSIETYTQLVIDKDDGKMFTRTKNNNGSQATAWKLSSYSPALDNQTITLDSLAPNLGIQNLTLQLEQYRGVTFKAKFYVPFSISNSTTPLTQVSLWSLPAGWAFDEEQNIPVYFFSTSPRANLFGYLHCVDNYIEVEFSDTLTSISAGWILRCCNSDLYLVKTSQ